MNLIGRCLVGLMDPWWKLKALLKSSFKNLSSMLVATHQSSMSFSPGSIQERTSKQFNKSLNCSRKRLDYLVIELSLFGLNSSNSNTVGVNKTSELSTEEPKTQVSRISDPSTNVSEIYINPKGHRNPNRISIHLLTCCLQGTIVSYISALLNTINEEIL